MVQALGYVLEGLGFEVQGLCIKQLLVPALNPKPQNFPSLKHPSGDGDVPWRKLGSARRLG